MKPINRFFELLSLLLQALIVGIVLAYLRHNYRWLYYPVKWFVTFWICLFVTIIGFAAFKLLFGISEKWFSQLMYDIGTSTNIFGASVWFTAWLGVVGSFITSGVDTAISYIEQQLFCGTISRFDDSNRSTTQTIYSWNPNLVQSFFWNVYGLFVFVFLAYKLLTHQGTSLFNIWE